MDNYQETPALSMSESPSPKYSESSNDNGESQTSLSDAASVSILDNEFDGNDDDPIAICGLSIKFPQDATSPEGFWKMMVERRCAMTEFPADRLNVDGFYNKKNKMNTLPHRGGHFLKEDLAVFDAEFFSISPSEAASMDPMQRWLLEVSYRALENAGIPMESVSGTSAAVYTGSFGMDYMLQLTRDPEDPAHYAAVGLGLSMLANRISWFFNLMGPSLGLDTACSSTANAMDIACKSLRDGSTSMALVAGANLANAPEPYLWMSNVNFLSPDSRCHSFDHRANGYARGEGIGVVVLKRLSDALRDGNTIRAVVRSTGSNEDGRTPGITQPSRKAQEKLILETYRKAGLSMAHTRYFEAHGTGTAAGDPREAQAIGSAFQKYRSHDDPLYVGALKSNIGHLEGASGIAGVIKAVLVLEKGVIPPNTNFEKVNPKIDVDFLKLKFPQGSHPWPTSGLRRASVNSFGYGGSNAHVVLDDAYNYLRLRSLRGKHCTVTSPPLSSSPTPSLPIEEESRLFIWSTKDKDGINRIVKSYEEDGNVKESNLANLAYTLDSHRSHFPWRAFAVLRSVEDFTDFTAQVSAPVKIHAETPRWGFVFSGQGAQWFAMGIELTRYISYRKELEAAGTYLRSLGCGWSVFEELQKSEETSNIDNAEFSQTLCTVLQVALVNLLRRFNLRPSASVGHSSGEIAAAYAAGYLSQESAWKLAYFRGLCSAELAAGSENSQNPGAMISVGLSDDAAKELVATVNDEDEGTAFGISIACINSPSNVTISGEDHLIDQVKARLDEQNIFARKLRVTVAYHSRQMNQIATKYSAMVGSLSRPNSYHSKNTIPMISTVTGEHADAARLLEPEYWAENMVSPVQFNRAVSTMCAQSRSALVKKIDRSHVSATVVDHLLEIGPHAALQGPIKQILASHQRGKNIGYNSVLLRGKSAVETMLNTLGQFYSMGAELNFRAINEPKPEPKPERSMLVDIPEYPFDHSQRFWHESRLSKNYRLRENTPSEFLGVRSRDWNPQDARWRHFIRTAEMPWTEQHAVNGTILYPGTGMLVMAIEAAKQLQGSDVSVAGYTLRDVHIEGPIDLSASTGSAEVQTSLRDTQTGSQSGPTYEFHVRTFANEKWLLNCRGSISVELSENDDWKRKKAVERRQEIAEELKRPLPNCKTPVRTKDIYSFLKHSGYEYGPLFNTANKQYCNEETKQAKAEVTLFSDCDESHVVHPVSLDVILHLCFTAFSVGGTKRMATCIPTAIKHLWISSQGLSSPEQERVTTCTTITGTTRRGFSASGGALDVDDSSEVKLWYEGLELTNVTSTPPSSDLPDAKQWCMNIDHKVALDKLTLQETKSFLDELHPSKMDTAEFFRDVEVLVEASLEQLVNLIDSSTLEDGEEWKRRYFAWAKHHISLRRKEKLSLPMDEKTFQELNDRLSKTNQTGLLYATVTSNLVAFFKGEASPLELLMKSGLLKGYYEESATYRNTTQAAAYIDLLAHQTPGLKLLEVGGGTGSATRPIIKALRSGLQASPGSSLRCEEYNFTDVSSAFLDDVRQEFSDFHFQINFGTLDVEKDFAPQGFEDGHYDVIVADNVLHATSDIGAALQNARKALKPGGKLLMTEALKPDGWTFGYLFGVFPGWWLGSDSKHKLAPNLTAEDWNALLKANGFSGTDLVFRDFDDDTSHHIGSIISTAVPTTTTAIEQLQPKGEAVIVIDQTCMQQKSLAETLSVELQDIFGEKLPVLDMNEAFSSDNKGEAFAFVFFLADYGPSFLASLNETKWDYLQNLVHKSRRVLWVSAGGGTAAHPDYGMIDGLARTLRSEYYELHLVTLALDAEAHNDKARHLVQVAREMLLRESHANYEQEYLEIDNHLHTRRLEEAQYLKQDMDVKLTPYQTVATPISDARFEMSATSANGQEDVPHYVESPPTAEMKATDVEIVIKAVSLQQSNQYCSGVVLNAGPSAKFWPGDRVVAVAQQEAGSKVLFHSHINVSSVAVARIPDTLSFSQASWLVPPTVTAYTAFVEIGRVRKTDTVLVHEGASSLGQAAIRVLTDHGITGIWTTASSESEGDWIAQNLGLAADRVLPRDWFESSSMLVSQLRGQFDIVLSAVMDSQAPLLRCWDLIRSGGRYIVVRTGLASSSNTYSIPASIALSIIHPATQSPTQHALEYAAKVSEAGINDSSRDQPTEYEAEDSTAIFTHLQTASEKETIVVNLTESSTVNVRKTKSYGTESTGIDRLDPEATYVIAGGLGGLGRSIARWLASHGARFLILLSRSGPQAEDAKVLVANLEQQGVHVEAPKCDITNITTLETVLASCSKRMPPIKGCIQSTMLVVEGIFSERSYSDWKYTVDPKVTGSWNLHTLLPPGLDFFILISSMMGVTGGVSLAAYNAGNTYKDALAHYRVSKGERAVALNLGPIPDAGYLIVNNQYTPGVLANEKFAPTYVKDVCALLEIFCDPQSPLPYSPVGCQAVLGSRPPAHWKHLEDVPMTYSQPFWGHMHHVVPLPGFDGVEDQEDGPADLSGRDRALDTVERLKAAGSLAEGAEVVSEALAHRVALILGMSEDRLDEHKPMHSYGLDSLSAIDVRNWVGNMFDIDMPVFEILGGATFASTGMTIARKVKM